MRSHSAKRYDVQTREYRRKAAIAVLAAFLMIPLLGMVALAVDYGYLLVVRTDLQRSADAAALAAVRDLVPDPDGTQHVDTVRATVRAYAAANVKGVSGFSVAAADITIGRYDPATIYTGITILDTGVFDTVQVTLRRDSTSNSPVSLFFARIFGINNSGVSATSTAVLQKASQLVVGSAILPFAMDQAVWNSQAPGDVWSVYNDGRLEDEFGASIPGNWGTLDIGNSDNDTDDLVLQILKGLQQADLDFLYGESRIPSNEYIESDAAWNSNADTGLSVGIKNAIQDIHGETRLVPIYDTQTGIPGDNLEFHIVGWGVVQVVDSSWQGQGKSVTIQKAYTFDGTLTPQPDLSDSSGAVEGAYTSPVLVK